MGLLRNICFGLSLGLSLAAHVRADAYNSAVAAAADSGKPRLALYALAFHNLGGDHVTIDALKSRYGLGPNSARKFGGGIAPLLYSDTNINGGTPGTIVMIGGLPFSIDPASRAVAGVVAGGRISAFARTSPARGLVLDLSASAFAVSAVQRDSLGRRHGVAGHQIDACLSAYLGGAQWMDLCAGTAQNRRSMGRADIGTYALAYSRQAPLLRGFSEGRVALKVQDSGDDLRPSVELGLTHASAQVGTVSARAEWFDRIHGQHGPLFSADLSLTRPIAGKTTTLFAAYSREGGAQFFGLNRQDQVRSLGLSRALTPRATVTLRWNDRTSSLANYTAQSLGFELRLTDLPF